MAAARVISQQDLRSKASLQPGLDIAWHNRPLSFHPSFLLEDYLQPLCWGLSVRESRRGKLYCSCFQPKCPVLPRSLLGEL